MSAWDEIIRFLGLPRDCVLASGWIAAGFAKNMAHDAMSMQASPRRENPYHYGDMLDVRTIFGVAYTTVTGDRFLARCHHMDAAPKRQLMLKVMPETFHLFREHWFEDLWASPPPLAMYRLYGIRPQLVDARGRFAGKKVRWGRG